MGNVDVEPISYFGIWGANDNVVPPLQNQADDGTLLECRSSEPNGWFYTTADCVTKYWAKQLHCNEERESIQPFHSKIKSCWTYKTCNIIEGCSWTKINSNTKMCKEALSNRLCRELSSNKKKRCRKIGCVWKKNKKKCKGRW